MPDLEEQGSGLLPSFSTCFSNWRAYGREAVPCPTVTLNIVGPPDAHSPGDRRKDYRPFSMQWATTIPWFFSYYN